MLEHNRVIELIKEAQEGSEDAKEKIIQHNMPLIKSIIRRYKNKHIEYDDLIQLGSLGLIKAINNFDTSYNVRFSTYAVPMIAGEVKRFIRDDGAIKVSRTMKNLSMKINNFIDDYKKEHSVDPSIAMLSEKFDISQQELVFVLDSNKFPVSLYEKFDEENGRNLIDKIATDECEDDFVNNMMLKELINELPDRDKKIIYLRYFKDKTQGQIAKILNVSQVQISRLEAKIIEKIKKSFNDISDEKERVSIKF